MFRHHQAGKLPRKKIRVRTYTATGNSFLEVKQKDNHGKTRKKRIAVTSEKAVLEGREGEDFLTERTGLSFYDLHPTLSNRFNRITLVNRAKTERLTIDFDLVFHNRHSERSHRMENAVIIELKRDEPRCFSRNTATEKISCQTARIQQILYRSDAHRPEPANQSL